MELLVVVGRLLFSSFANVFQKKLTHHGLHPFFIVLASYIVLAVICLPLLWAVPVISLTRAFWLHSFLAAALDMSGTLFLVMSLSKTDLSVFGPLNAYKVVISMLLAMVFIGEVPSTQGFIGVGIIVAGSYLLFPPRGQVDISRIRQLLSIKGVQYRFLSIVLFSIGTLPLKQAVVEGGPLTTTVFWCLFGLPLSWLVHTVFICNSLSQDLRESKQHVYHFVYLGILIFLMQFMTMIVFSKLLVAYSLALFQLSMVLQVFLGYRIFNEEHIMRRLGACLVMVIGSLLVMKA